MSAFVLGASQLLFFVNFFWSAFKGPKASGNPWNANGPRVDDALAPGTRQLAGRDPRGLPLAVRLQRPRRRGRPRDADRPRSRGPARGEAWSLTSSTSALPPRAVPLRPDQGERGCAATTDRGAEMACRVSSAIPRASACWRSWARSPCCSSASRAPTSCAARPPTGGPSRPRPCSGRNTAALLLSSVALERARRRLRGWDLAGARTAVLITGLLGLALRGRAGGGLAAARGARGLPRLEPAQLLLLRAHRASTPCTSWAASSGSRLVLAAPPPDGASPRARTASGCSRPTGTSWAACGSTCSSCSSSTERGRT